MSSDLPPAPPTVKFVQPLLARSNELASIDPVISYYCKLHAVQQIVGKNLHQGHPDVEKFASALLDNIEYLENTANEATSAIIDDKEVARAYVESFALKVFAKADKDVRNKTTTKNTSTTFLAAATFYDILHVFSLPLEKDVTDKIKYAKWHAARIIKAYKSGEDPNEFDAPNDKEEEEASLEAELEAMSAVQDEGEGETQHNEVFTQNNYNDEQETSLIQPFDNLNLPNAPPVLPSAPPTIPSVNFPSAPRSFSGGTATLPNAPNTFPPPPPPATNSIPSFQPPPPPPPSESNNDVPRRNSARTNSHASLSKADVQNILDETELVSSAQKHAKFAISALNYDDIPTAVKELKTALAILDRHRG